jgi:uncharacterized BrkB/YihY/UPF0761 family membrane protein
MPNRTKIYVLSVILAPLGLYWVFKYIRSPDRELRKIAYVTLGITLFVTLMAVTTVTIYTTYVYKYVESYGQLIESVGY